MSAPPQDALSRRGRPRLLSVVAPAYDEEDTLPQFAKEVGAVLGPLADDYEIVVVDDGSRDRTLSVLTELSRQDPRIRWISLSRNFGHQAALLAGLEHASGDVVVTMDADLQHPPALLPRMVDRWRQGYDVVYTIKSGASRALTPWRRLLMNVGYWILRFVSGLNLQFGQSDFRLLDRVVLDVLISMPERDKFLRGLIDWVGFGQCGLEYELQERFAGAKKYTFRQLVHLVTTGVFAFTILPLRLFTAVGMTIACLSLLYGVLAVIAGGYALIADDPALSPPRMGHARRRNHTAGRRAVDRHRAPGRVPGSGLR